MTCYLPEADIADIKATYEEVTVVCFQDAPEGKWTEVFCKDNFPNHPTIPIYVDFATYRWRGETYREYLRRTNDFYH